MKKYLTILLGMSLVGVQAQKTQQLTLSQAIDLGMKNSRQLMVSDSRSQLAQAKYDQQRFSTIPALTINSSYNYLSPNVAEAKFPTGLNQYSLVGLTLLNQQTNRASLSQTIFAGLRGWNIINATKNQMQAAQLDAQKDQAEVKNNIITAFYNHYKLTESKQVVDKNIEVLEKRKTDMQNMEKVGMALKNDVLKVDLALLNLKQSAAEVQSALDISNFNLDVMLGLPEGTIINCATSGLFPSKPNTSVASWLQTGMNSRPDLKAAVLRRDAANRMVKVARGGYSPVINAGFNFYYSNPNQRVFLIQESQRHSYFWSWDIGVSLSWNLTNLFTTTYQIHEAKANLRQADAATAAMNDASRMEINANYSAYKLAIDKINMAEKAVEQSTEDQRITKNQYDNGIRNITDLLEADNNITRSQINLVNARIDAEIAYAKLVKAAGN
ncbi:MAG: TolC family protein [Chitinophagales bacterium]